MGRYPGDLSRKEVEHRLLRIEDRVLNGPTPEEIEWVTVQDWDGVDGDVAIDVSQQARYNISATGDITIVLRNTPDDPPGHQLLIYLEGGNIHSVSWPADVVWDGGEVPTSFDAAGLEVALVTDDGGDSWRGRITGENFA